MMEPALFDSGWLAEFKDRVNADDHYRSLDQAWEWPVLLRMTAAPAEGFPEPSEIFIDLCCGQCREARLAVPADDEAALFVMRAAPKVWIDVMNGRFDIVSSVLHGNLALERGNLALFASHTKALKALVAIARQVSADPRYGAA